MAVVETLSRFGVEKCIDKLLRNPEEGLAQAIDLADRFAGGTGAVQRARVRRAIEDASDPYYPLLRRILQEVDPRLVRAVVENLVAGVVINGRKLQKQSRRRYGCDIPSVLEIETVPPRGEADRSRLSSLELAELIFAGKQLGIYVYIFSGGDPLLRRKTLMQLARVHDDCLFLMVTAGSRIDAAFCREVLAAGNVIPVICASAESRSVMQCLRGHRLFFGVAVLCDGTVTQALNEALLQGAFFCWLTRDLSVPAAENVQAAVRDFRTSHPLAVVDFPDDAALVGGCIGWGRYHIAVTAQGYLRPCPGVPPSEANIRRARLINCLQRLQGEASACRFDAPDR